jgi:hypothetical protein
VLLQFHDSYILPFSFSLSLINGPLRVSELSLTTMAVEDCIVHSSKHASEFRRAIVQLRREKKFPTRIFHQLSAECCSCNGQIGKYERPIFRVETGVKMTSIIASYFLRLERS